MIFGGSYAGHNVCDWRAGVSIFIIAALIYLGWAAIANFGMWLGEIAGYPETGAFFGVFGIPILAILVNGWIDMWQDARHEGEVTP